MSLMANLGRPAKTNAPEYGSYLAKLRNAAGLSQQALADTVGVRQATVAAWERSSTPPRGEFILSIAEALDVSAEQVLTKSAKVSARHRGPASKIELLFEEVSSLPRRRQERIATVLRALLAEEAQAS